MASPVLAIDADALAETLDPLWLIEQLRIGHQRGIGEVERLLLTEPTASVPNALLTWIAWRHGEALGAKLATVFPGNEARGAGPNIRSVVLLFDGRDGRPEAVITGESFTRIKTAATSALGQACWHGRMPNRWQSWVRARKRRPRSAIFSPPGRRSRA